ncbi:MAG: rhodanese-like domain-containing protein [Paracoccus aminovorans]|nr:rhodanese-like domain-containing protein [Paracoccus aminovorans]
MTETIGIAEFRALYAGRAEFAVIDPREELVFSRGHLFGATNLPLSRLELRLGDTIPRRDTLVVLCDDGGDEAEAAARLLAGFGHGRLRILAGGISAWQLAGGAVFRGIHVPSKTFGELVEQRLRTPSITAAELEARQRAGADLLLLDARPLDEHRAYCVPGATACPSTEMIHRAAGLRDREVVVHCGGRTRAIIGAQTLIDSGLFGSVRALENGTPGWQFAGFAVERGNGAELARPAAPAAAGLAAAARLRRAWGVPDLDAPGLRHWLAGAGTRYLIDIRSASEFVETRLPGARHVPGGELLQATEAHLAVQNAGVALVDSDGIRAVTCAVWLRRMGWAEVVTHSLAPGAPGQERGAPPDPVPPADRITVADAAAAQARGALLCDIRPSPQYRRGHAAGAAWLNRGRLGRDLGPVGAAVPLVLIADDPAYAALLLRDLRALGRNVRVLHGGIEAWRAAGLAVEAGLGRLLSAPVDSYLDPDHFDEPAVHARENRAYIDWEIALPGQIGDEPAVRFRLDPPG